MAASGKTLSTEAMDDATERNGNGDGRCDGDVTATAIEGASNGNGGRNRAMAVAAMVGTTIAMAANGETTIN